MNLLPPTSYLLSEPPGREALLLGLLLGCLRLRGLAALVKLADFIALPLDSVIARPVAHAHLAGAAAAYHLAPVGP